MARPRSAGVMPQQISQPADVVHAVHRPHAVRVAPQQVDARRERLEAVVAQQGVEPHDGMGASPQSCENGVEIGGVVAIKAIRGQQQGRTTAEHP